MCTQKKSLDNWDCRKLQPTYGDGKTKGQIRQTTDLYYVCEPTQWIQRGGYIQGESGGNTCQHQIKIGEMGHRII